MDDYNSINVLPPKQPPPMTETQPTREQMLTVIYQKIARKDLSFGCIVHKQDKKWQMDRNRVLTHKMYDWYIQTLIDESMFTKVIIDYSKKYRIIGHPVMIGDVLDWVDKNTSETWEVETTDYAYRLIKKRKNWIWWLTWAIDLCNNDCIEYVYNLCK